MVAGPTEHGMQADVIFVIEATAVNGAYLNDLKTNYLIPTLEYFSQGGIEDREFAAENSTTLYGIVIYHAADCLPSPCTGTLGPFSNPQKLLLTLEKLEMVGGKGESCANIGEGLATALQCFEDLQARREPNVASQKHCILVCNSPPYQTVVQESYKYANHTVEQLAGLFQDRSINFSILSPRKIPVLFKLFEKAGGDLQSSQTKNYAKDPRHLVLLRNYNLKERPVSPTLNQPALNAANSAAQIPLSPLQSNDSPNTNQTSQNINQPAQTQAAAFRGQAPQNINTMHQNAAPIGGGRPAFNPQISAPPNYHPNAVTAQRAAHPRWMRPPFMTPGNTPNNPQSSALIAQLTQPPNSLGLNVTPFGANSNAMAPNQQQQLSQQQQQQLRLSIQIQQQQQNVQQQNQMGMPTQVAQNQPGPQLNVSAVNQSMPTQVSQTVTAAQAPTQGNVSGGGMQSTADKVIIWQGVVEWLEKNKNPNDNQKHTRCVPCQVSANVKDGEPDTKADSWPSKLIMQLMPKHIIATIGNAYLKNAKNVTFYPSPGEAYESLVSVMTTGFAGCVHFTTNSTSACDIKVLLLLYTSEKRMFMGFIPNDQQAFVDRLRKVIQHQKTASASIRQGHVAMGQAGTGPSTNPMPSGMPTTGISQGGILMSQTNTMAMGGGQITQNVVNSNNPQQNMAPNAGPQGQINLQNAAMSGPQQANAMMNQQRPPFDDLEIARQQNLIKIQQLRQTLEAAQQQEAQYKSQLEIQQNLEVAQQQEMQYKQQLEAQQAQRGLNPQAGMAPQQSNAQRMMRPVMPSNLGLRHLLQQQQPQYRQQVLGMQQQMVGPRGQMNARPMGNANPQNQPFEDVTNYDFLG